MIRHTGRDDPNPNVKRVRKLHTGNHEKDPEMLITKRNWLIPENIFGKDCYGFIDINGEWVKDGKLIVKKEGYGKHGLEYIALTPNLDPNLDWSKIKRAIRSEIYSLNQFFESCKRYNGFVYLPKSYDWFEFKDQNEDYEKILFNKIILEAINSNNEARSLYNPINEHYEALYLW